ncbi:RYamide receptor-like [Orbicella faveolata]|uniref:RYamide receptor-like n=1 Tax=Orbicella faveolata TaxID=48498 RepID=UPI0009E2AF57|nr:RYamide receptor-like [Orbicella faveolata]
MSDNVNTTMNATQSSSCPSNSTVEKIATIFPYCLIFLVSLAGNTVIGIIVFKTQTMRKPINFFIVNMVMSDLLYQIIKIPQLIQVLYIDSWLIDGALGQALCKLVYFLKGVSHLVSIQSLVLIAVDRFGAVVFPLRSPLISSKLCPLFITASWIVAIAVNSPKLLILKLVEYPEKLVCKRRWNEVFGESSSPENYRLSFLVVFTFIPLVLLAIVYIIIYLKLKSQKIPGAQSANAGQQRQRRERNVLKMAIAIVLGFAMCRLPLAIWLILLMFTDTIIWPNCAFRYSFYIVHLMALVNCVINPCICFIFSRNYRKELKALVR